MAAVDATLVRAILSEFDPACDLVSVDRPGEGAVNRVFFLGTTRGAFVLKVFDAPADDWKIRKDVALSDHLRGLGIPAPDICRADASRRVVPFAYSLSPRLPGQTWSSVLASLTAGENRRIYGRLGDYLGRIHATTFDRFGDVVATEGGLGVGPVHELGVGLDGRAPGPFATWRDLHGAFVDSRLRLMEGARFGDLVEPARAWFDRNEAVVDILVTPRLLHMDLHRGNVLILGGEISGILDFDESIVGHNEYDLMRTELAHFRGQDPAFAGAFMAAYQRHVALDEGHETRKRFYDASRTLVWIQSLLLSGDRCTDRRPGEPDLAARAHLLTLIGGPGSGR